jgi:hypothetical protein
VHTLILHAISTAPSAHLHCRTFNPATAQVVLQKGQIFCEEEEPAECLAFVLAGRVQLFASRQPLSYVGACLGLLALVRCLSRQLIIVPACAGQG